MEGLVMFTALLYRDTHGNPEPQIDSRAVSQTTPVHKKVVMELHCTQLCDLRPRSEASTSFFFFC